MWEKVILLLDQGMIPLDGVIGCKQPIAEWREAFDRMHSGEVVEIGDHSRLTSRAIEVKGDRMNRTANRPKVSAFPKCYIETISSGEMDLFEWIEMSKALGAEGLEMYDRFFRSEEASYRKRVRDAIEGTGQACSMLCVSPDFTHPDRAFRAAQVEQHKKAIDLAASLGAACCRVLSGQRRTDVSRSDGVKWVVESIRQLLPYAESRGVILSMENHYKDGFWEFPNSPRRRTCFSRSSSRSTPPGSACSMIPPTRWWRATTRSNCSSRSSTGSRACTHRTGIWTRARRSRI